MILSGIGILVIGSTGYMDVSMSHHFLTCHGVNSKNAVLIHIPRSRLTFSFQFFHLILQYCLYSLYGLR